MNSTRWKKTTAFLVYKGLTQQQVPVNPFRRRSTWIASPVRRTPHGDAPGATWNPAGFPRGKPRHRRRRCRCGKAGVTWGHAGSHRSRRTGPPDGGRGRTFPAAEAEMNDRQCLRASQISPEQTQPNYTNAPVMDQDIKGKGNGRPYSITECRVPELISVLGSQPVGDVSHKPSSRLPLLSTRVQDIGWVNSPVAERVPVCKKTSAKFLFTFMN